MGRTVGIARTQSGRARILHCNRGPATAEETAEMWRGLGVQMAVLREDPRHPGPFSGARAARRSTCLPFWESQPHPRAYPYPASKAALVVLTKSPALELAPPVRVNAVVPGFIRTDIIAKDGRTRRGPVRSGRTSLRWWRQSRDIRRRCRFCCQTVPVSSPVGLTGSAAASYGMEGSAHGSNSRLGILRRSRYTKPAQTYP